MIPSLLRTSLRVSSRAAWLFPAVLGAALYLVNLSGTWIYDDAFFAREDPRLKDVHRWGDYLTQSYFDGQADALWRPLVSLSYAVEWRLHAERAWPFHLVNLLLHAGVCMLVVTLGRRLSGSNAVGWAAGLLFAAHPIHVDAVSGIVGRAEEMCTMAMLAALLLVIGRPMTIRRALAVTGCFLFAALSKEQGILLPFMLLAWAAARRWWNSSSPVIPSDAVTPIGTLDYASPMGKRARSPEMKAAMWLIVMLTLTLAIYVAYRDSVAKWYWDRGFLDWTLNPIVRSVGADRWLMPVAILGRYATLLVAPWRLAPDYSAMVFTPIQRKDDPYLWLGIAALLCIAALLVYAIRRRKGALLFCLAGLGISYFLASNVVIIGTIFGERLMYLPSVFACILAAMALAKLPRRNLVLAVILAAWCVRTETYAWQWNDRLRFYRYADAVQPSSAQVILLLADELHRRGNRAEAMAVLARGREVCPGAWKIMDLSVRLAMEGGDYGNALIWARQSLKLRPGPEAAFLLSDIYEQKAASEARKPGQPPG